MPAEALAWPVAMRTTLLIVLSLAALMLPATTAVAQDPDVPQCTTLSTGETACGDAESFVCSGAGAGVATGLVHWKIVITTSNVYSQKEIHSPAAVPAFAGGGLATLCTTATCTFTSLYANDQLVAQSMGVC